MPRWGVSWGSRLFRIGQSPDGRWWGYFNILGFRFFRYLDDGGRRRWTRKPDYLNPGQRPVTGSHPTSSGTSYSSYEWIQQEEEARSPKTPKTKNDSIVEAIYDELDD